MINYERIMTQSEIVEYITNVWKRDPVGYDTENIISVLDKVKKRDDLKFKDIIEMMSNIYNY
jgi:hypothetical protein